MALGVKQHKLGIAAATTWVIKDAFGKCSRMFWASQHGVCQCSALFTRPLYTLHTETPLLTLLSLLGALHACTK
jgi:hypothetical protein